MLRDVIPLPVLAVDKMAATFLALTLLSWNKTLARTRLLSRQSLLKLAGQGRQERPQSLQGQTAKGQSCVMMLRKKNGGRS